MPNKPLRPFRAPQLQKPGQGPQLPALRGKESAPLARRSGSDRPAPAALSRFQGKKKASQTGLVAGFRAKGDAELAQRRAEELQAQFERRVEDRIGALEGDFSLRLAVVLDYTASTIGDVRSFVAEVDQLLERLGPDFSQGIRFLPVIARGLGFAYHPPEVLVGMEGSKEVFGNHNVGYKRDTPVGAGVIKASEMGFLGQETPENEIQAAVAISDEAYEIFSEHDQVMRRFAATRVAVASLTSGRADTHQQALQALGELGIVVPRSHGDVSSVTMIAEFISNLRLNVLRARAAEQIKAEMEREKAGQGQNLKLKRLGFAEQLRLKGHSGEASRILQGGNPAGYLTG